MNHTHIEIVNNFWGDEYLSFIGNYLQSAPATNMAQPES